jgi:hypothetical protein
VIEGAVVVNRLGELLHNVTIPREARRVISDRLERIAKNITQEHSLKQPHCPSRLKASDFSCG